MLSDWFQLHHLKKIIILLQLLQKDLCSHCWVWHLARSIEDVLNSLFGFVLNQKIFANSKMTFKTSYGILLALGILALVQLHATASTSTSTREFFILPNLNAPCPTRPCYILSQVMDNSSQYFTSNTRAVFPQGIMKLALKVSLSFRMSTTSP